MRGSDGINLAASTDLRQALFHRAGDLIYKLDQIQSKCHNLVPLEFPQIIVVGEECSGKSTVLERIAMLEFFPRERTSAICTRMPTKLKLCHKSVAEMIEFCITNKLQYSTGCVYLRLCYHDQQANNQLWSQFFSKEEVEVKINEYTKSAVASRNGKITGVVDDVMLIEVTSNMVPNLTLVDLPGIVGAKIGNEPDNMMEQTRRLVEKYISQPHTLVIAIVPAYQRVRNAQCMQLVQKYGKERMTLGVLTMADKAFQGNLRPDDPFYELKQRLDGTAYDLVPLPLGYVAVKNRDNNIRSQSLIEAAAEEIQWFSNNLRGYRESGKATSDVLVDKLVQMLCDYVKRDWVPKAKNAIETQIIAVNSQFATIGDNPLPTLEYISKLVTSFTSNNIVTSLSMNSTAIRQAFSNLENIRYSGHSSGGYDTDIWRFVAENPEIEPILEKVYQETSAIMTTIPNILFSIVEPAFQQKNLPTNLSRFANLHKAIKDFLMSRWNSVVIEKSTKLLSDLRAGILQGEALYYANCGLNSKFFYNIAVGLVVHKIVKPCLEFLNAKLILKYLQEQHPHFQLLIEESDDIKKQRSQWQREVQDFKEALAALETIA